MQIWKYYLNKDIDLSVKMINSLDNVNLCYKRIQSYALFDGKAKNSE